MSVRPPQQRVSIPRSPQGIADDFHLSLQGAFQLAEGAVPLVLPGNSQRLLAFLALSDRRVTRAATAGMLWPEASEAHAHASLRSALSRLDKITRESIEVDFLDLRLAASVAVDIRDSRALAHRLLIVDTLPSAADMSAEAIAALSSDLLPDWYDEWAMVQAEDWRQLRLHALEALAGSLVAAERYADATTAALAAINAEPLRESAHAALIRVHLAEGNQSEALRAFERYRALLMAELGLEPTPALRALIRSRQPE
jgi:DNA-binding SARP family transcriptional activator